MKHIIHFFAGLCILALLQSFAAAEMKETWLDTLDMTKSRCGYNRTQSRRTVEGNPLSVGGEKFERGVGTHTPGEISIAVDPVPGKFTAKVGIDDEVGNRGHAEFLVYAEEELLWRSGFMVGGEAAKDCHVEFNEIGLLRLVVDTGPEGYAHDHTDWLDAKIFTEGKDPVTTPATAVLRDHDGKIVNRMDENAAEWLSLVRQIASGMQDHIKKAALHPGKSF